MKALIPQETYRQISDISLDYLINDKNIKGIIFDFDGTLLIKKQISEGTINFIKNAKNKKLKIAILSNNIYVNPILVEQLEIKTTKKFAFKPLKKPFLDLANAMNLPPENIAVIGNNRIADIYGANKAKMYSIYIQDLQNFFFKKRVKNNLKNLGIKKIK